MSRHENYFTCVELAGYLRASTTTIRSLARELKVSWNRRLGMSPRVALRVMAEYHRRQGEKLLAAHGIRTSETRSRK